MNRELNKELKEISSTLAELPVERIEAPEGYFDDFSDRMLAKVKSMPMETAKPGVFKMHNWEKYLSAAAVFIFIGLSILIFKIKQTKPDINSISTEDIYLSEIDEATLIEYTNLNSKNEINSSVDVYQDYVDEEHILEEL